MHECDYYIWGGSGRPPPENFEKPTLKPRILRLLEPPRWVEGSGGGVIGFSHQICTDLKNGPVELQKAWKPEKPEKGWPLQMMYNIHEVWFMGGQFTFVIDLCNRFYLCLQNFS